MPGRVHRRLPGFASSPAVRSGVAGGLVTLAGLLVAFLLGPGPAYPGGVTGVANALGRVLRGLLSGDGAVLAAVLVPAVLGGSVAALAGDTRSRNAHVASLVVAWATPALAVAVLALVVVPFGFLVWTVGSSVAGGFGPVRSLLATVGVFLLPAVAYLLLVGLGLVALALLTAVPTALGYGVGLAVWRVARGTR